MAQQKLKVVLISTFERKGGAAIAAGRLLQALNQTNEVEATMLVSEPNPNGEHVISANNSEFAYKLHRLKFIGERLCILPFETSKDMRYHVSLGNFGQDISNIPEVKSADVIHLHWFNQGFLSLDSLTKLKKPIIWTLHDMWAFTGVEHYAGSNNSFLNTDQNNPILKLNGIIDWAKRTWLKKDKTYKKLNIQFATCSNWLAEEAKKSTLLKNFSVTPVPNPIDTNSFKPLDKKLSKAHFNLDESKTYILFGAAKVSDTRKGIKYFLEAVNQLPRISEKGKPIKLLVFGGKIGNELNNINLPFTHLGSLSTVEDIVNAYNCADVFVSPALQDNLPNTVMEALSCGVPVVAFNTGGLTDLVKHKENGYLAELESIKDLKLGIEFVLNHPNKTQLSENSRNYVLEQFNENTVAEQYISLYKNILNS